MSTIGPVYPAQIVVKRLQTIHSRQGISRLQPAMSCSVGTHSGHWSSFAPRCIDTHHPYIQNHFLWMPLVLRCRSPEERCSAISGVQTLRRTLQFDHTQRRPLTAHHRLRLDLYERRFAVYDATKNLLATIGLHGQVTPDNLGEFYIGVRGAEFRFDGELRNFLMQIGDMGFRARVARSSWERRVSDPSVDKLIDEEEAILSFLHDQDRRPVV
jgi:hypothetical protein